MGRPFNHHHLLLANVLSETFLTFSMKFIVERFNQEKLFLSFEAIFDFPLKRMQQQQQQLSKIDAKSYLTLLWPNSIFCLKNYEDLRLEIFFFCSSSFLPERKDWNEKSLARNFFMKWGRQFLTFFIWWRHKKIVRKCSSHTGASFALQLKIIKGSASTSTASHTSGVEKIWQSITEA